MHDEQKFTVDEFSSIVEEHQASVRACIRVLGIPTGYVDDVAQETFLVAYKKLNDFDESKSMRSWLLGIARNLVLNERRKTARRFRILNDNLTEIMQDSALSIMEDYEASARLKAVRSCIQDLPEKNRNVLNLKFERGKTAASIAVKLQRDSSTIRHLLSRIISSLKKCVDGKLGGVT
jgi:RNA polymerase sigma-70 factor, ECF subfamily